jgi:hypothetical protein
MASPEFPAISKQLEQIPTENLHSVEMNRRTYQQLAKAVLNSPQVDLDSFEQSYNTVFDVNEQDAKSDPEHGYKVTAAFEQLQASGEVGLSPISEKGDNATFKVTNFRQPSEPQSYRQAKKSMAQSSKTARKSYDAKGKTARGTEIPWSKVFFGNRKVRHSRDRSATLGEELHRITTPVDGDGRLTQGAKLAVAAWGKDSIREHTAKLDKAASDTRKRELGIAKRNSLPEIDPAVAEWASKRETVVKFVGSITTEADTSERQNLANIQAALFTQPSVESVIRQVYESFTTRVRGSGLSPEEALNVRGHIIHAEAKKAVETLTGTTPSSSRLIERFAALVKEHYAGQIGQNAIRDYEELKKQVQ